MGLIAKYFAEFRGSLENPQSPLSYPAEWLLDMVSGGRTDSGIRVSEMLALQVPTVYACVQLVSSAMGFLPFHVYEQIAFKDKRASKRLAVEHDFYDLIRFEPNPEMTAITFRKTLQAHALLWGNLYGEIQRDNSNGVVALWPRNPARIRPYRIGQSTIIRGEKVPAGTLVYKCTENMEEVDLDPDNPRRELSERYIPKEDIIHIPGLSFDGRLAHSVVRLSRQAIGLSLAGEKYGAKFFANNARPGGLLQHPGKLTDIAAKNLKQSWQEAQGGENMHRLAILEEGMVWKETGAKNNEAQFLETREFQKQEICSIFAVPPHMIGDSRIQNRSNVEQMAREFVNVTLGPWLESWQQEIKRKLFPKPAKTGRPGKQFFVKFETRMLTMPDAESQKNFIATVKQWGIGSTNDMREWLDWDPIDDPDADELWRPVNMTPMGAEAQEGGADQGDVPDTSKVANRFLKAYSPLFSQSLRLVIAHPPADLTEFRAAFLPILHSISDALCVIAGQEFSSKPPKKFIDKYLEMMKDRSSQWRKEDIDELVRDEASRAIKALLISVYREAATKRAIQIADNQEIEVTP